MEYEIRTATVEDIEGILDIYGYYVKHSTATAELEVPTECQMKERMQQIKQNNFPYFVAETQEGKILGYAYVSEFSPRKGYRYAVSIAIYMREDAQSKGIAAHLLQTCEQALAELPIRYIVALISGDNHASLRFHLKHGFHEIGRFPEAMNKFDQWIDLVWLLKTIK